MILENSEGKLSMFYLPSTLAPGIGTSLTEARYSRLLNKKNIKLDTYFSGLTIQIFSFIYSVSVHLRSYREVI